MAKKGNVSITNKDLTLQEQVEIFVSMYAKLESAKSLLIAKGFSKEKQDQLLESSVAKEKVKETLDKFSKESGEKLTSDKVDTIQSEIQKLLGE